MLKVMIVEDEPLIRAGLKEYFPWNELGIGTIVEAENGKEGIATALREWPDLIITDIRMPEMNGLEMIEQLKPLLPNAVFIILTGYSEFQYAQDAIRLGVVKQYLLKPLEYEPSMKALTECIHLLQQSREEQQEKQAWQAAYEEHTKWKESEIVKQLLEGVDPDEVGARLLENDVIQRQPLSLCVPIAATCFARNSIAQGRKWRALAERIVAEAAAASGQMQRLMVYTSRGRLYMLLVMEQFEDKEVGLERLREQIVISLERVNADATAALYMALGHASSDVSKLADNLHAAAKALLGRFADSERWLIRTERSIEAPSQTGATDKVIQLRQDDRNALLACLEQGDGAAVKALMDRLCAQSAEALPYVSGDQWLAFMQEIISVTLRFAHKQGFPMEGVSSDKLLELTFVDDFRTLDALFSYLAAWVIHLNDLYGKLNHPVQQENLIFNQIRSFIENNLDQDITLQMVADHFFYNPSYLSRLFKSKLNQNYLSFVTEIRIAHAKKLLEDPNRLVTEVCTMCGYRSYKHFVKMFRFVAGMTPTDYRKQLGILY
ncbi:response regulator transcription factor [Paenibacillus sp. YIM B09110]|uniref:response regulator transcription factor n=1 Tax=Paenibacillus sp. YIM B09110 TaxID=3126102 RepID=UPI00301DD564